ncbi:MAG: DUF2135 domain-containing protein [Proteobacteria bacterium]|nr:DUF2135 domain-containing protein [Pseudomonadota bacterium]
MDRVIDVWVVVRDIRRDEKALRFGDYALDVHVSGMFARVSTAFSIYNDNGRNFEGALEFPLPDGGVVCGYAIDIDGVMTDARVVEKEKARIAFEAEVKLGADPGLVEQVKGNAYRTRIYPIPAHGSRRIRVDYVAPVVLNAAGDAAVMLPMPKCALSKRDVVIEVEMPERVVPKLGGLGDRRFERAASVWRVEAHDTDVTGDDLCVGIPEIPEVLSAVETCDGDCYFSVSARIGEGVKAESAVGERWRIVWDASGSRAKRDIELALEAIAALPEKAHYELIVFRNVAESARVFESRGALVSALGAVVYDGGTDLSSLLPVAAEPFDGMTLVFSDGMDTFESDLPMFGANSAALYSGHAKDAALLRRICGGCAFDLGVLGAGECVRLVQAHQPVVAALRGEGISDVQGIGLSAVGRVTVLGRLQGQASAVTLELSDGRTFAVSLSRADARDGRTLASAWAARRVEELSARADENREILLAIGRHFSIVSPVSSMIVFERLDQWLKYDIEPPEALKELHEAWMLGRKSDSEREKEAQRAALAWKDDIEALWRGRVHWWETPVPKREYPKSGVFSEMVNAVGGAVQRVAERLAPGRGSAVRREAPRREYTWDDEDVAAPSRRMEWAEDAPCEERTLECSCEPMMMADEPVLRAPVPSPMPGMMGAPAPSPMPGMMGASAPSPMPGMMGAPMPTSCPPAPMAAAMRAPAVPAESAPAGASAAIAIKAWDPKTPYLEAISDAGKIFGGADALYAEYVKQREKYQDSPAFFLDCAGLFFKKDATALAVRILSNLSEIRIENEAMLRVYAWRLREAGELDLAVRILRKVAKMRPDELVSWRDLALTLELRAKRDHSVADAEEALECFKKAAFTPAKRHDGRYTAIVALEEFNALAAWCEREKWPGGAPKIPEIDAKFRKNLDTDLRIVMMWDADDTDIDLHVLEPSGEEVYYGHKNSESGGMNSDDVTTGYGPEEYLHKKAPAGTYRIMSNYFASHQQMLTGPVTVTATVFTNWGRETQTSQTMSLRLEKAKDKVAIGSIEVK